MSSHQEVQEDRYLASVFLSHRTLSAVPEADLLPTRRSLFLAPQFISQNSPVAGVAKTFGPENWARLERIKRQWDPSNMFRFSIGGGMGDQVGTEVSDKGKAKAMS